MKKILNLGLTFSIIIIFIIFIKNNITDPMRYCWKSNSILTEEEIYANAMRNYVDYRLKLKERFLAEPANSGQRYRKNAYYYAISPPISGTNLEKSQILAYLEKDTQAPADISRFFTMMNQNQPWVQHVNEDVIEALPKSAFQQHDNRFNLYWTVFSPNLILLEDCCAISTKTQTNFSSLQFNSKTDYLSVKLSMIELDDTNKFKLGLIRNNLLLNGCGDFKENIIDYKGE